MEPAFNQEFKLIFGEETLPYAESLEQYYSSGPQSNWREAMCPYASSHPTEDWAETWSTYLMIASSRKRPFLPFDRGSPKILIFLPTEYLVTSEICLAADQQGIGFDE